MASHAEVQGALMNLKKGEIRVRINDVPLDLLYFNRDGALIEGYEIKPTSVTREEFLKGLGQCAYGIACGVKPYFVIAEKTWEQYKERLTELEWLSVLTYDKRLQFDFKLERKIIPHVKLKLDGVHPTGVPKRCFSCANFVIDYGLCFRKDALFSEKCTDYWAGKPKRSQDLERMPFGWDKIRKIPAEFSEIGDWDI